MTNTEKIIKYIATAFGALLAVSIIVVILETGLYITRGLTGGSGKTIDRDDVFTASEIDTININNSVADVDFVVDSGSKNIRVKADNVSSKYTCTLLDGTLKVKNRKVSVFSFFNHSPRIKIYVPDELTLKKLFLQCGVGDVDVTSLTIDKLQVEGGVGDIEVKKCTIEYADFDMGVGDMEMKNCVLKNAKIDNGVGDVELKLNGNIDDYVFDIDNGLGDVDINGKKAKAYKNNSGPYKISCDNGIGDLEIDIH